MTSLSGMPQTIDTRTAPRKAPERLDMQTLNRFLTDPEPRRYIRETAEERAREVSEGISASTIAEMKYIQADLKKDLTVMTRMIGEILNGQRSEAPSNPMQEILERLERLEELHKAELSLRP